MAGSSRPWRLISLSGRIITSTTRDGQRGQSGLTKSLGKTSQRLVES